MGIPQTTSHHVQVLSHAHTGHPGRGRTRLQGDDDEEDGKALLRPDVLGQGQPDGQVQVDQGEPRLLHGTGSPSPKGHATEDGDETSPFLPCPHLFHCVAIPVHRYHHLGKRATPEEETAEFLNDWVDFQGDLEHKIGNLTCVFDKMGLHTASGDVNLKFFTTDFWNNINLGSTLAGSDPNWRSMLTTKWTDSYNKAQAIPTETLTRMSFMKSMPQLARNMEFWMCAMEAKTDACSAALQHSMLEDMYGKDDGSINWTEYGLPADKYELASVATMVLINSKSDMEKFICSFFESDGTDM